MYKCSIFTKLLIQIALITIVLITLNQNYGFYKTNTLFHFFHYLQLIQNFIFNKFQISIGDILYLILIILLLVGLFRFLIKKENYTKIKIIKASLKIIRNSLAVYLILFIFWGHLYYQKKISDRLKLSTSTLIKNEALVKFDSFLIGQLNALAPHVQYQPFNDINDATVSLLKTAIAPYNIKVKPSMFGETLSYLGIEGYFNPFTGEAQVNPNVPFFILPFTIAHEASHQFGIAAEDDANLSAYILCISSKDTNLKYAAYFTVWLYVHKQVSKNDPLLALNLKENLNIISLNHLDILKARSQKYHTIVDTWSTYLYDLFLKSSRQKDGILSYNNIVNTAYLWEQKNHTF